eukprot:COSAG01_NODE_34737_length_542_cov_45.846501_1_plen_27_part_01
MAADTGQGGRGVHYDLASGRFEGEGAR